MCMPGRGAGGGSLQFLGDPANGGGGASCSERRVVHTSGPFSYDIAIDCDATTRVARDSAQLVLWVPFLACWPYIPYWESVGSI